MAVNAQQKFDCAVKVIKSLPKNGSFQPSHEMMLRFYAYYKQAVEGPCSIPQPGFWDVVGKAKWNAWNDLGDLPKEKAMLNYVEELKQIIETMPQTQNVADFMGTLGDFYEMVDEKTPFANDKENVEKTKSSFDDGLRQIEGTSIFVDTSLSHSAIVEQHLHENGLINGDVDRNGVSEDDEDDDDNSSDSTEHQTHPDDDEEKIENDVDSSQKADESQPTLEEKPAATDSETESEDFCDTSDEPSQFQPLPAKPSIPGDGIESSTPISNKTTNRVRFSDTQTTHSAHGQFSPIARSSDRLLDTDPRPDPPGGFAPLDRLERLTGRRAELSQRVLTDSLLVNTSAHEHANTSLASQMDDTTDSLDLSYRSYCETGPVRGGAAMATRVKGSKQGLFSARRGEPGGWGTYQDPDDDVNKQISVMLLRLQQDLNSVRSRLDLLQSAAQKNQTWKPTWWPFEDLSTRSVLFIVTWPFIAHLLISFISRNKTSPYRIPHR